MGLILMMEKRWQAGSNGSSGSVRYSRELWKNLGRATIS